MDLHTGNIVMLRSGGPKMTIAAVKQDRAYCVWFNQRDTGFEEKTGEFLLVTLKRVQPVKRAVAPRERV